MPENKTNCTPGQST